MRVIGLLSWYEENPTWLAECVASAARLCDHLIAVDGPYALFPGSTRKPFSGTEQAETILRTAAGAGMGVTIHAPRQPWWDGEVGKRDTMFRLGEQIAEEGDWYLRIDADEVLTQVPGDVKARLEGTDALVAEVMLWEREANAAVAELVDASADYQHPLRVLFRAIPGIRIEQAHYVVTVPGPVQGQPTILCGNDHVHRQEPALTLHDVRLEHRTRQRPKARQRLKEQYYSDAERLDIEHLEPFESVSAAVDPG